MRPSVATIRQRFIREYGAAAFQKVARAFVDAGGDCSRVRLSEISEWRRFASSFEFVPVSAFLPTVFLWCVRHSESLKLVDTSVSNDWVELVASDSALHDILMKEPFAIARNPSGYVCEGCNTSARTMADMSSLDNK